MNRDTDFGVPIPGKTLPREEWARTAIKKMPPEKRAHVKSQWQQYQQSLASQRDTGSPVPTDSPVPTGSPDATGSQDEAGSQERASGSSSQ